MNTQKITVETTVNAPIEKVWHYWNEPEHINQWAFATDEWEADAQKNDLTVGGKFSTIMGAKDKSSSFDFAGVYTAVDLNKHLAYSLEDGREVQVDFNQMGDSVKIVQTFDAEKENSEEMQRAGWQAYLDNFKKHVEAE